MKNTNYIFERIIFGTLVIALLVVIGMAIYKRCTTQVEAADGMFVEIETHFSYTIMYDKNTKVMYYRGTSAAADLCPLYNADGSLKLYSGGN